MLCDVYRPALLGIYIIDAYGIWKMAIPLVDPFLARETCLITVNYAYYHVFMCLLQAYLYWRVGRTQHFASAHAFGWLVGVTFDFAIWG